LYERSRRSCDGSLPNAVTPDRQLWRTGRRGATASEGAPLLLLLVVIGTEQQQGDHDGRDKEREH
jgi:hypothetical protein